MFFRAIKAAKPGLDLNAAGVGAFADEKDIAGWAINEVRFCSKHGIMKGKGVNLICPKDNTSRQEGVILVKRTYEAFINK